MDLMGKRFNASIAAILLLQWHNILGRKPNHKQTKILHLPFYWCYFSSSSFIFYFEEEDLSAFFCTILICLLVFPILILYCQFHGVLEDEFLNWYWTFLSLHTVVYWYYPYNPSNLSFGCPKPYLGWAIGKKKEEILIILLLKAVFWTLILILNIFPSVLFLVRWEKLKKLENFPLFISLFNIIWYNA